MLDPPDGPTGRGLQPTVRKAALEMKVPIKADETFLPQLVTKICSDEGVHAPTSMRGRSGFFTVQGPRPKWAPHRMVEKVKLQNQQSLGRSTEPSNETGMQLRAKRFGPPDGSGRKTHGSNELFWVAETIATPGSPEAGAPSSAASARVSDEHSLCRRCGARGTARYEADMNRISCGSFTDNSTYKRCAPSRTAGRSLPYESPTRRVNTTRVRARSVEMGGS